MIIDHDSRFVFLAVPKTASTSIETSICKYLIKSYNSVFTRTENIDFSTTERGWVQTYAEPWFVDKGINVLPISNVNDHTTQLHKHSSLQTVCDVMNISDYYTFCCVRNSWDLVLSWYFYYNKLYKRGELHSTIVEAFGTDWINCSFNQFVDRCPEFIFTNQLSYTSSKYKQINYIMRYDKLNIDWMSVSKDLFGEALTLPRMNTTNHSSYVNHYDEETRNKVTRRCQRDIVEFGFKYGQDYVDF